MLDRICPRSLGQAHTSTIGQRCWQSYVLRVCYVDSALNSTNLTGSIAEPADLGGDSELRTGGARHESNV